MRTMVVLVMWVMGVVLVGRMAMRTAGRRGSWRPSRRWSIRSWDGAQREGWKAESS